MIEVNPPHIRLTDMGSTNGTVVNGKHATSCNLAHGDGIRGGDTLITVQIEGLTDAPSTDPSNADRTLSPETIQRLNPDFNLKEEIALAQARMLSESDPDTEFLEPIPGYRTVRELGQGGMGVVALAERESSGQLVALKTISPASKRVSRQDVERFLREAKILKDLDHPNIVRFEDVGEADGQFFFAMEFVDGHDLKKVVKDDGPLPMTRAVGLTCQLLEGLQFAHDQQIVHRDIKPSNMLVHRDLIKLADFGLARVYQASSLSGLTMEGEMGGSLGYMPPEQITNFRNALPANDIYSTGASLYELLCGKLIYDFPKELNKCVLLILQDDPVPLSDRAPDLPSELIQVVHRSIARDPANRFESADEMREALVPFTK